jgi:predicted RNase H-like HicB family nuclease
MPERPDLAGQLVENAKLALAHARGEYTPPRMKRVPIPPSRSYAIVIEAGERNYSGYVPDVPGCVAAGETIEEVTSLLREALAAHLALLATDGEPVPEPSSLVAYVDVPLPVLAGR